MTRVIGLDYGEKRIGVSVSDPLRQIAFGAGVIENKGYDFIAESLKSLLAKYEDVEEVIVGMPLSMRGQKGVQAEKVEKFIDSLKDRVNIPVKTFDERLTTAESTKMLRVTGVKARKMRNIIDEASAMNILQRYLEMKK
ncbi:Holliday junction resolvase RuvX [Candidatus Margulisiibacteriota bacterium]